MDIIFNNYDLLKIFAIALIKLDIDKEKVYRLMYHIYYTHQSNKCLFTNLLFPESKETCDEILSELENEKDPEINHFILNLKSQIQNQPFDRSTDAVQIAQKCIQEINEQCKKFKYDQFMKAKSDFTENDFSKCQEFEKESILYRLLNSEQKIKYMNNKKLIPCYIKNISQIYSQLTTPCTQKLYNKVSKISKLEPLIWEIRRNHGDEIIFACGDSKTKMDMILRVLQKIYL